MIGDGHDGTRETCRCQNCRDWRNGRAFIGYKDGREEWAPWVHKMFTGGVIRALTIEERQQLNAKLRGQ